MYLCRFGKAIASLPAAKPPYLSKIPCSSSPQAPKRQSGRHGSCPAKVTTSSEPGRSYREKVRRSAFEPQELAHPRTLKPYTEEEMATLQKVYTPEQIASIEAGEAAVDPEDLKNQAVMREDSMRLDYFDDLKNIHPVVDKPVRAPEENYDPNLRFKTQDEFVEEWARWFEQQGDAPDATEFAKFQQNQRLTVGKEEAERDPRSYKAPTLPVIPSLAKGIEKSQTDPARQRLMQQTGFSDSEIRRLRTKILVRHRVVNQTSMGKKQRNYALCVAGNGKGLLGIGEGKSTEILDAMKMATFAAIRTMVPIPRYEERTIYGDVHGKVAGTVVELMHRTPGFGIRCQHLIYEMCRCAGISDLAARVGRSRNKMNTVKATLEALLSQQLPEDVARARGRKLVDIRKVYYAGKT